MKPTDRFIGRDVHKDTVVIAEGRRLGEVASTGRSQQTICISYEILLPKLPLAGGSESGRSWMSGK